MEKTFSELTDTLATTLSWVKSLDSFIPAEVDFSAMARFLALFAGFSLLIGVLCHALFGKRSSLNHSLSSVMGILCIYAVTVVILTFEVTKLTTLLTPLPFVAFTENYLILLPFHGAEFSDICAQIVSMVILAFLYNLLDTLLPKGKNVVVWFFLRFLTVALAMGAHWIVTNLLTAFLPGIIASYAPVILLGVLIATLVIGLVSLIVGFLVSTVNPIAGVLTTFFFHNMVGKQLSKACLTTALLTALFYAVESLGYTVILISESALLSYLPMLAVLLVLWYVIGHIL